MPSSRAARMTRTAISPRLAIRILLSTDDNVAQMSSSDATPPPWASGPGDEARSWPAGWHVDVVDETGSTNDDLLAAADAGAPDRTVLATRHQTAGRGRLDRRWDAPPGANLLVSLLVRDVPAHLHQATQRVALAACDAVAEVAGVRPELK